jgi:nonsense-mediated mRNA decay protein 3
LADISQTTEFVVLDIEPTCHPPKTAKGGRFLLADAQVSPVGGSMNSDVIYHTRTHLGAVLKPGDTVLGYMLGTANFNNEAWDAMNQEKNPEIILVRKTYPNRRKKSKARGWRLKSIVRFCVFSILFRTLIFFCTAEQVKEVGETEHAGLGREKQGGAVKYRGAGAAEQAKAEADYEMFLRDIEEDEELRQTVNLYKGAEKVKATGGDVDMDTDSETTDDEDDEFPTIRVDDLLDGFDSMKIDEESYVGSDEE